MSFKLQFEKAYTIKLSGDYTSAQSLQSLKYHIENNVKEFPSKNFTLYVKIEQPIKLGKNTEHYISQLIERGATLI